MKQLVFICRGIVLSTNKIFSVFYINNYVPFALMQQMHSKTNRKAIKSFIIDIQVLEVKIII